jgi:type VI secretion system protein ImpL
MGTKALAWLIAAGILLLFVAIAWPLPGWLGLEGTRVLVLRIGLILLGAIAATLTLLALLARARKRPQPDDLDDDIDQAFATAERRLAASNLTAETRIARLPLTLVLGPTGSTKSSVLTHSGLDPELLAGEVMRGDATVPTDPVNIWYAQGTIVVEAGGRLLEDADRWRRAVRHLHPAASPPRSAAAARRRAPPSSASRATSS